MSFVYPQLLWALSLITIPIIIHLFRFRKFKNIYFSNTSLLSSIVLEKQNKNRIKNLILLLIRILTIITLVLAFSQPYILSSGEKKGRNMVSIYIDNSPSMENIGKDGKLIETAKKLAKQIIKAHDKNDKFCVISNNFKFNEQQYYISDDAISMVDEIETSPVVRKMSSVFNKIMDITSEEKGSNKTMYFISDFQKSTADVSSISGTKTSKILMVPVKASSNSNLSIDSCWFSSPFLYPFRPIVMYIKIRNFGDQDFSELSLNIELNGISKIVSFDILQKETKILQIPVTFTSTGWIKGILKINDYPVSFDDSYFFSINIKEKVNIGIIHSGNVSPHLLTAFSTDNYFNVQSTNVQKITFDIFSKDFIITDGLTSIPNTLISLLNTYIINGGSMLIIPCEKEKMQFENYENLFSSFGISAYKTELSNATKIEKINDQHPLFNGIFEKKPLSIELPSVSKVYSRSYTQMNPEYYLMTLNTGEPFLSMSYAGKGLVYVLSVPLSEKWSNFQTHSLFIPVIYQISLFRTSLSPLAYSTGINKSLEISSTYKTDNEVKIEFQGKEFKPFTSFYSGNLLIQIDDNFSDAGFYQIKLNKPYFAAVNYSRQESDLDNYSINELKAYSKDNIKLLSGNVYNFAQKVKNESSGTQFWKILIWISLLMLLSEVLITRFYKVI